jgi:hypothetical protein
MSRSLQIKNYAYAIEAMARVPDLHSQYAKAKRILDRLLEDDLQEAETQTATAFTIEDDMPF